MLGDFLSATYHDSSLRQSLHPNELHAIHCQASIVASMLTQKVINGYRKFGSMLGTSIS